MSNHYTFIIHLGTAHGNSVVLKRCNITLHCYAVPYVRHFIFQNIVTPFVIVNFSHHEHLHLPKDHVVAFAEKDCNDGKVLEICTMEQLERDLPRNWIPERKRQEKMSEFFENPFMKKDDDFLKSPAEAPVHRKVLLEDKNTLPKTRQAFDELCQKIRGYHIQEQWRHQKNHVSGDGNRHGKPAPPP